MIMNDTYLTLNEVAERLKLSRITVYRYVKAGTLPAYKFGRAYRLSERELIQFIEEHKVGR